MKRALTFVSLVAVLASGETAEAGGYHWPDIGTVAMSRGGAFTARADNPTAIVWNPAGAAWLKGTHIVINGTIVKQDVFFQRRQYWDKNSPTDQYGGPLAGNVMPAITNDDPVFITPLLAVTTDLGIGWLQRHRIRFLLGVYGPNAAPTRTYPRYCVAGSNPCKSTKKTDPNAIAAPQRYETVRAEALAVYPSIGVAWAPIPQLAIGGVFQLGYANLGYSTVISAFVGEDPGQDLDVRLDGHTPITPTGIVGAMYKPFRWLQLGASLRFAFDFDIDAEVCLGERQPDGSCTPDDIKGLGTIQVDPNPAKATLTIPMQHLLRTGVRYINYDQRDRERFDVELDFVYEMTSRLSGFALEPVFNPDCSRDGEGKQNCFRVLLPNGQQFGTGIRTTALTHGWNNVFSFRLGGSYRFNDLIPHGVLILRGGGFYESRGMPDEWMRLDFLPLTRLGLSAGIGVRWQMWEFNVGYSFIHHVAVDVDPPNGQACGPLTDPDNPPTGCGNQARVVVPIKPGNPALRFGNTIGNGRYEVTTHQVTFGARVHFGKSSW